MQVDFTTQITLVLIHVLSCFSISFSFNQIVLAAKEQNTAGTIVGFRNYSFSSYNANSTLNFYSDMDLTGFHVKTTKPVSALMSSECVDIPYGVICQKLSVLTVLTKAQNNNASLRWQIATRYFTVKINKCFYEHTGMCKVK